jgi:hypothetical protein
MATTHARPARSASPTDPTSDNKTPAIKIWAGIGLAFVLVHVYIIGKWITGPNFKHVPQGPSQPPTWMRVELIGWQVVSIPAVLALLYFLVIRPWRRDRHVGIDGLFVIAGFSIFCQDVWSSAGNHWFTYNASMVNFGSWANDVPWFNAYGKPGHMLVEPILFLPAAYAYNMTIAAAVGCWVMRKFKSRRPQTSTAGIVAFGFVAMCAFDVLLEGIIFLPLGVFEYGGGHWNLFSNTYHRYPLNEMVTIGAVFTALATLKFFRDDRGLTVVERGVDKLGLSPGKTLALRAFAVVGFVNLAMFAFYNVPNTLIGINGEPWPADLQQRSYFLNGICGEGTDRACPGGSNPHINDHSVYPNTHGGITVPDGVSPLPQPVPLQRPAPAANR